MDIYVNGQRRALPEDSVLGTVLEEMGLTGKRVAVEVNREIVPRAHHAQYALHAGDHVEIVEAIGGG